MGHCSWGNTGRPAIDASLPRYNCWLVLESAYWLLREAHSFSEAFGRFMLIRTKWHFWTSWRHFGCTLRRSQLLCLTQLLFFLSRLPRYKHEWLKWKSYTLKMSDEKSGSCKIENICKHANNLIVNGILSSLIYNSNHGTNILLNMKNMKKIPNMGSI